MEEKYKITGIINETIKNENMDICNYYLINDKDGICKICVVVEKLKQRKINLTKTIRRKLFHEINFPFDIFIYEKEEFYKKSSLYESIGYNFQEEGEFINGQESAFC